MSIKRLYVDIDGVLAKWQPEKTFAEVCEKGYFRSLPPQIEVVKAIDQIIRKGDVEVFALSAILEQCACSAYEKSDWLHEYLPTLISSNHIFVPCGTSKAACVFSGQVASDCFLLDDYTPNLTDWEDRGGSGIKLLNGINHTNGSWQGSVVSGLACADDIVDTIEKCIRATA